MLKWYKDLYIGKKLLKHNIDELKAKLESDKFKKSMYLITIASNEENQLDIINVVFLNEKWVYEMTPLIVGIAKNKYEAEDVMMDILTDCYRRTGGYNMRRFLLENNKEE